MLVSLHLYFETFKLMYPGVLLFFPNFTKNRFDISYLGLPFPPIYVIFLSNYGASYLMDGKKNIGAMIKTF